ncbi:hypothetical protein Bca101_020505 [Brassica carinata]
MFYYGNYDGKSSPPTFSVVAVPRLQSTIPIPDNPETIMHLQEPLFPKYTPPSYTDILSVEAEPDLEVTSSIPILSQPVPGWGVWPDASNDERVSYMEQLIADHRPFKKEFWHGGDTSVTIIDESSDDDEPPTSDDDEVVPLSTTRKSKPLCGNSLKSRPALTKVLKPRKTSKQRETVLKPRKTARKTDTVRKQRRISNYFHVASSSRTSDDKILELLSGISEQLSNIQKEQKLFRILLKRQSTPSRLKRSAFRNRSNIFTAKKTHEEVDHQGCHTESPNPSTANQTPMEEDHQGCQTEPLNLGTEPMEEDQEGCQTEPLDLATAKRTLMEEDHTFSHSPVVSQYAAQKYGSTALNKEPSSETAVRETGGTTPVHTSPIHASPNHKPSIQHHPDHEVSDHNIPTPKSPFTPKDTPIHPPKTIKTRRSVIYDAKDHPDSPEIHHIIYQGKEIFERISPDPSPPSLPPPKYDSSVNPSTQRRIFPLSPLPSTPQPSPNKSSDGLPGFIGHASAVNAFSETATSSPFSVANSSLPNLKDQPAEENEVCELSDSSPARERPKHIPSVEENILAKELYRSESVPALDLICPLNQSLWDRRQCISLTPFVHRFHITPSKFDFSNNFLLQLAKPSQWTTTYHMEILMYMLAARHSRLLEEQKLAFITPHLTSGIQAISKNFMKSRKRETFQWDEKVTEINKSETHLFKWVDEALLDEIRIVDAKRVDLLHELQALTGKVNVELESHRLWLVGRAEEMRNEINENMVQLTKAIDESTSLMKAQIDAKVKTHTNSKWSINQTAAAMAMIGAITYLYWKLL